MNTALTAGTLVHYLHANSLHHLHKFDTSLQFHTISPHTHTYTHQLDYTYTLINCLQTLKTSKTNTFSFYVLGQESN